MGPPPPPSPPASDGENKAPPPVEEEEEEENPMTLEEYMKAQANKAPVGKILTARKVDEGPMEGYLLTRDSNDVGHDDAMYGMAFHDYDGKKKEHEEKEAREGWVDADNSHTHTNTHKHTTQHTKKHEETHTHTHKT